MASRLHPDLARARFIPRIPITSWLSRVIPVRRPTALPVPDDFTVEEVTTQRDDGGAVSMRVYRPTALAPGAPALFWMNGGGYIGGSLEQEEFRHYAFARELGVTVVAVRYRVAPAHPSPAALDDAYAGLRWVFDHAQERGIDPARIAIGGDSAGGGLAAALALYAHDRAEVHPAFQLLVYPMLDDRTVARTDHDTRGALIWQPADNRRGWSAYLGVAPGSPDVPPYAAPSRREDLAGLPPAWIGVGTLDVFHDEDVEYARRLVEAGVPCELTVVDGAFHGFDALFPEAPVVRDFHASQVAALRGAFSRDRH